MIVPCPAVGPTPTGAIQRSASPQTRPSPAIGCSAGTVTSTLRRRPELRGRPPKLRPGGRRPGAHPQPSGLLDRQPRRCRLHLRDAPNLGGARRSRRARQSPASRRHPTARGTGSSPTSGRVLPYGHAQSFGDMSAAHLNGPVLDSVPTPSGRLLHGRLRRRDLRLRRRHYAGSMGGKALNAPVQYWYRTATPGLLACRLRRRHLRLRRPLPGLNGRHQAEQAVTGMVRSGTGLPHGRRGRRHLQLLRQALRRILGGQTLPAPIVSVAVLG